MKNRNKKAGDQVPNLCYKCSIGKHSQHSFFTGKGLSHGLWKEALENDPNICRCPKCMHKGIV